MKTWLLFLLKLLLTAGCLAWVFAEVDFRATILARPGGLKVGWVLAGLGLAGVTVALTALRWGVFLAAQNIRISFGSLFRLTLIGNFFSLASLGGLGGDAARIVLLCQRVPRRKIAITTAVLMDHLSGMVALALMFFLLTAGWFAGLEEQSSLGKGVIRFAWVYLGGGLVLLLLGFFIMSPLVHGRVHRGGRWIRWEFMQTFPEAWDRYRRKWKHGLAGIGLSCAMLVCYYLSFWAGARAVGSEVDVGEMFAVMPVIDGISAIPVTVSGIGVREKLFEVLLADLAGVPEAVAVSVSLTGFAFHVVWALAGAVVFFRGRTTGTVSRIRPTRPSPGGRDCP